MRADQPVYRVHPYLVERRPPSWFAAIEPGIERFGAGTPARLRPAWALADMLHTDGWGRCGLDPDDIESDAITEEDVRQWERACGAIGADKAVLLEVTQRFGSSGGASGAQPARTQAAP